MVSGHHLSERRAGCIVRLSRDSHRNSPTEDQATLELRGEFIEIVQSRRHFGCRRVHDLLCSEFLSVNHKRVYRLYAEASQRVPKHSKAKRPPSERVLLQLTRSINEVLSMDFVSDSLANGRRIKCLTVVDNFSHVSVEISVDYGISGLYVALI